MYICCDVKDSNINGSVQKFYCKVNSVLYDFKGIPCDVKTRLLDTYCLDLYGFQLWNYSKYDVNHFYVAWRKTIRRLRKFANTTNCNLLSSINSSEPIVYKLEKRCAKFIWFFLNIHNCVIKNIALSAKSSSSSDFGDNYIIYLSYKYNIVIQVWNLSLCKLYKCFDIYLSHDSTVNPDGVFIRELCLLRDDYSLIDNNDVTKEEVSHIIRNLCIS